MPLWPAWAMFAAAAACAYPAVTTPAPGPVQEHYEARGQEPGWNLRIHSSRIDYTGDYGDVRITQLRPEPRPTANGRRYVTDRLVVAIVYQRCNDAMSGRGYAHQVTGTADRQTFRGCGGNRREDWDA
jgi:uncharacterized membrane protein